jgi:hypothetical protein
MPWNRYLNVSASPPIFSFGFGLSFSRFEYSSMRIDTSERAGIVATVSCKVRNAGDRLASEIAQLYVIVPRILSLPVPQLALQGFEKLRDMHPGETRTVHYILFATQICTVRDSGECIVSPGSYSVSVGGHQPGDARGEAVSANLMGHFTMAEQLRTDLSRTTPLKTDDAWTVDRRRPPLEATSVVVHRGVIHRTDPHFKCWTIDSSSDRQFFTRNWSSPMLRYYAKKSLPGYVRFGGTGNDVLNYSMNADCNQVGCLNRTMFDSLMGFVSASGGRLVFGLNVMKRNQTTGAWDPTNARQLLEYAVSRAYKFYGLELGNVSAVTVHS